VIHARPCVRNLAAGRHVLRLRTSQSTLADVSAHEHGEHVHNTVVADALRAHGIPVGRTSQHAHARTTLIKFPARHIQGGASRPMTCCATGPTPRTRSVRSASHGRASEGRWGRRTNANICRDTRGCRLHRDRSLDHRGGAAGEVLIGAHRRRR
jgi:hypothetical protein